MDDHNANQRLGHTLVLAQLIRADQLSEALMEQRKSNESLGEILIRLKFIDPIKFALFLAKQMEGDKQAEPKQKKNAEIFVFQGTKGGVGNTFVAVNTAVALSASRHKCCILDLNLTLPQVHLHLNQTKIAGTIHTSVIDFKEQGYFSLEEQLIRIDNYLYVLCGPHKIHEAEEIEADHIKEIITQLRSEFDYIIIDLPGEFTEKFMVALDEAKRIILTTDANFSAINNAIRIVELFEAISITEEKLIALVNRHRTNDLALQEIKKYIKCASHYSITSDMEMVEQSINKAFPIMNGVSSSIIYADLANFINQLIDKQILKTKKSSGFWDRIWTNEQNSNKGGA